MVPGLWIFDVGSEFDPPAYSGQFSVDTRFELSITSVGPVCPADWNNSGAVDSQDFFDYLNSFFESNADFNNDGVTDSQDFFDFMNAFFVPC